MSKIKKSIIDLKKHETGTISGFSNNLINKSRNMEMGLLKNVIIRMIKKTPFNGPIEVNVRNYYLAIRYSEAVNIYIQ